MADDASNPSPAETPPTLHYAKRPPLAWVSRHRRLLIFLALCFAIAAPIWWYWRPIKHRALWLYWSHRAAEHMMPPNAQSIVLDPLAAKNLLAANPDYTSPAALGWASSRMQAFYCPVAWRMLQPLDRCYQDVGIMPIAFLGTLHRPDGTPRVVVISSLMELNGYDLAAFMTFLVLPAPGLFESPSAVARWGGVGAYSGPGTGAHLDNAAIDPADSSHLKFDLMVENLSDGAWTATPLDVYLQNDDSLLFKLQITPQVQRMHVRLGPQAREVEGFQEMTIKVPPHAR